MLRQCDLLSTGGVFALPRVGGCQGRVLPWRLRLPSLTYFRERGLTPYVEDAHAFRRPRDRSRLWDDHDQGTGAFGERARRITCARPNASRNSRPTPTRIRALRNWTCAVGDERLIPKASRGSFATVTKIA